MLPTQLAAFPRNIRRLQRSILAASLPACRNHCFPQRFLRYRRDRLDAVPGTAAAHEINSVL
jgi:hypothetical protein